MELQLRLILPLLLVLTIFEDLGLNAEAKGVLLIPRRRIDFNSGFSGGQGAMMRSFQAMREDPRSIYRKTNRRGGVFDEPLPSNTEPWTHDKTVSDWNANDISQSASVSEENEPNASVLNDEASLQESTTVAPTEMSQPSTVITTPEVETSTTTSPTTTPSTTSTTTPTTTTTSTTTTTTSTPPAPSPVPSPAPIAKELESSTVKSRILRKKCGIRCGLF